MKHIIFSTIVILAACNNAKPIEQQRTECEQSEVALTECLDELAMPQSNVHYEAAQDAAADESTEPEYAVTDWQFRAETCESELLNRTGQLEICVNQTDGDIQRSTDLRDALRYFDVKQACIDGVITTEWICTAAIDGNL